jgi:hypothetical protein
MSSDPIVDELDRLRAEEMARFNFDFEAFFRALKDQERRSPTPPQAPPDAAAQPRLDRGRFARR